MSSEHQRIVQQGGRWLRVGLLTYTLAAPVISALLEQLRQRPNAVREQAQEPQENIAEAQAAALARLAVLTAESRQLAQEQMRRLQEQAREVDRIVKHTSGPLNAMMRRLRKQTQELETLNRQLRKAVRKEAKQRRKYFKQLRKASSAWSQEVVERTSKLTQDFIERSGKVTSDLAERSTKLAQDLADFSSKATKDLVERSNEATLKLAKRSKNVTQELVERGDELLEPVRIQTGNGWTIFGFSLGVLTAAIVTYILIRRRMVAQELEELEQQIELPQNGNLTTGSEANQNKPVGEIRSVDDIGTAVVTLPVVDVVEMLHPEDAKFVGVASTRLYYPVEISVDANDLVYFISEEEAQNQGFTAAQSRDEQL